MTIIAALLSVKSIWVSRRGQSRALDEAKNRFAVSDESSWTCLLVMDSGGRRRSDYLLERLQGMGEESKQSAVVSRQLRQPQSPPPSRGYQEVGL